MMKYELTVKRVDESNISQTCPFPAEEEDFDIYLDSLVEDLEGLVCIESVERHHCSIIIDTSIHDENDLKAQIKPYFEGERFCQYRFIGLKKLS